MKKNPWERRKTLFSSPLQKTVETPKRRWMMIRVLWQALKRTCTFIGAVILIFAVLISWSLSPLIEEIDAPLPNKMVLYLELDGNLSEIPPSFTLTDPLSAAHGLTVKGLTDALYRAKDDPRVVGLYAKVKGGHYAVSHVQEIRAAIADFKRSGKFAYIYAPSYDNGLGGFYLASIFEERWMQPMGSVMMTGLNAEMPFAKDVLDSIGVKAEFFQRKEYKSAYENLTHSKMTPANKEALGALIGDIADAISTDISKDLGIEKAAFKPMVDHGLFMDQEALDAKLISHLEYEDVLWDKIRERVTGNTNNDDDIYVYVSNYIMRQGGANSFGFNAQVRADDASKPNVALIYAVGAIMDTSEGGAGIAAADEISQALYDAAYDTSIEAVVFRVDSPGGSPVASETILRAVQKVQEKGKPVIVSMGSAAASGGYWISASADRIFALPTTITGSIGVLGGKFSGQELWKTLGVNWERISWGKNAAMFSMNSPFSKTEAQRMNAMLDNVYENFLSRVSKGRGLSKKEVENIAGGRVWSGLRGIDAGIVDELGGLNAALDYAAAQIGAGSRSDVDVMVMPKPMTQMEQFVAMLEGQVRAGEALGIQASLLQKIQPILMQLNVMSSAENTMVYAPVEIK